MLYRVTDYIEDEVLAAQTLQANGGPLKVITMTFWAEEAEKKFKYGMNPTVKFFGKPEDETSGAGTAPVPYPGQDNGELIPDWLMVRIDSGSTRYCYWVAGRKYCFVR